MDIVALYVRRLLAELKAAPNEATMWLLGSKFWVSLWLRARAAALARLTNAKQITEINRFAASKG